MKCRNCGAVLQLVLVDLGNAPLSNAYLTVITLRRPEKWFPLRVLVCETCWLVQAEAYSRAAEIFNEDYAYFSSFSDAWMTHAKQYVDLMIAEFNLNQNSFVVEVASNDGYLLRNFIDKEIPCLGVEPTASTAAAARAKGVVTLERFFGANLASEIVESAGQVDLLVANNVLAHVPEPHDFLDGVRAILADTGIATFEFPHLLNLIEHKQFDTIYHEHFAYLSFTAANDLMARNGLSVFRVQEFPTHGGSLRVFAQPTGSGSRSIESSVEELLLQENNSNVMSRSLYSGFQENANNVKNQFLKFLLGAAEDGRTVVGYGAAAKGNTLLNFSGVRTDLIPYVVDRSPAKRGKYLPGSRIPIVEESRLAETRPDYIVIFPWNLKDEIVEQLAYARDWGAKFVTVVPRLEIS